MINLKASTAAVYPLKSGRIWDTKTMYEVAARGARRPLAKLSVTVQLRKVADKGYCHHLV